MKRTLLSVKVLISLLVAILMVMGVVWYTTNHATAIKQYVQSVTTPNQDKVLVNELLHNVIALDQLQRNPIIADKDSSQMKITHLKSDIKANINDLKSIYEQDTVQQQRLDKVSRLLSQQELLLGDYSSIRIAYLQSDSVQNQITRLSEFLKKSYFRSDSAIFKQNNSMHSTAIADTIYDSTNNERGSFWDKLFGRKKEASIKEVQHFIFEQMKMSIDSTHLLADDSVLNLISNKIIQIQESRKVTLNTLNAKRLELDLANAALIHEVMTTLQTIDANTNEYIQANNDVTIKSIDDSIDGLTYIVLFFILLIIILGVWIYWDINKANQYKQLLIAAKEQAELDAYNRQQFLSNMSHELRTPLQSIIGYSELLAMDNPSDNTKIIANASKHLLGVVNQVLDFNRLLSGHFLIHSQTFLLQNIIDEVYAIISIQAQQKQLELVWNIEGVTETTYVLGDALRLQQIMINLLQNAIKFTPNGTVTFDLLYDMNDRLSFTIKDTGFGIKSSELQTIFNAYEQATNHHYATGSGLGLSIVHQLVRLMKGDISVTSEEAKGSEFIVSLPLAKAECLSITPSDITNFKLGLPSRKVIVVDDDVAITSYIKLLLEKKNVAVTVYNDPLVFLKDCNTIDADVILMDIRMPEMTGFELILKFKTDYSTSIPIIAFTAQVLPEELAQISEATFDGVLEKPFVVDRFFELLGISMDAKQNDMMDVEMNDLLIVSIQEDIKNVEKHILTGNTHALYLIFHSNASRLAQWNFSTESDILRKIEYKLKEGKLPLKGIQEAVEVLQQVVASLTRNSPSIN